MLLSTKKKGLITFVSNPCFSYVWKYNYWYNLRTPFKKCVQLIKSAYNRIKIRTAKYMQRKPTMISLMNYDASDDKVKPHRDLIKLS